MAVVLLAGCNWAEANDETRRQAGTWSELPVFDLEIPGATALGPFINAAKVGGDSPTLGSVDMSWHNDAGQAVPVDPIFDSLTDSGFLRNECHTSSFSDTVYYQFLRQTAAEDIREEEFRDPDSGIYFDAAEVAVDADLTAVEVTVHSTFLEYGRPLPTDDPFGECSEESLAGAEVPSNGPVLSAPSTTIDPSDANLPGELYAEGIAPYNRNETLEAWGIAGGPGPFDRAIENATGYDTDTIGAARNAQIDERASDCLAEAGWVAEADTFAPTERLVGPFDGLASRYRAEIEAGRGPVDDRWNDDAFRVAATECLNSAERDAADPYAVIAEALSDPMATISASVTGDTRVQQALARAVQCFQDAGYQPNSVDIQLLEADTSAGSVYQSWLNGELDDQRAVDQLTDTITDVAPLRELVRECGTEFVAVTQQVSVEYQTSYLADDPEVVAQAVDAAGESIDELGPYLPG